MKKLKPFLMATCLICTFAIANPNSVMANDSDGPQSTSDSKKQPPPPPPKPPTTLEVVIAILQAIF